MTVVTNRRGPAFYPLPPNTVGNSSPLLLPGSIGYIRLRRCGGEPGRLQLWSGAFK